MPDWPVECSFFWGEWSSESQDEIQSDSGRVNSGLDLDGDGEDEKKWKDWRNI